MTSKISVAEEPIYFNSYSSRYEEVIAYTYQTFMAVVLFPPFALASIVACKFLWKLL